MSTMLLSLAHPTISLTFYQGVHATRTDRRTRNYLEAGVNNTYGLVEELNCFITQSLCIVQPEFVLPGIVKRHGRNFNTTSPN